MTTRRRSAGFLLTLLIGLSACGAAQQAGASADPGTTDAAEADADAQLTFTPETDASATGTVTLEDGGTITATAGDGTTFELVVPAEAVAGDVEITLTPLSDVGGIDADDAHAVLLEPDGTEFYELARLTITPAEPIPVEDQLMFEADGDGADPALALVDPASEAVVILLEHFSVAGIATADEAQRARMLEKSAANAAARLIGQVRQRIGEERARILLGTGDDEAAGGAPRAALDAIAEEYQREVLDKRKAAAEESCRALREYIRSVISWERQMQLAGVTAAEESASQDRVADAIQYAQSRKQECEDEAIAACKDAQDPQILIDFWLWIDDSVNKERAEEICEPSALQFELEGSGNTTYDGQDMEVSWAAWGLLCEGTEEWILWDSLDPSWLSTSGTGLPPDDVLGSMTGTFDEDGVLQNVRMPMLDMDTGAQTFAGFELTLVPADDPTEVQAVIGPDYARFEDSAPVEPADGSIPGCEPTPDP